MPILHDVIQKSDAWDRLRLGIPTASNAHKILTPGGKPSAQWGDYGDHLIAERVLQRPVNTYTSSIMERGQREEEDAVAWYEADREVDTKYIGFVTTDDGKIGCSPDRLVGDDGLAEIKCPEPGTMIKYWRKGADEKYKPQLQMQLFVTGRKWVDIIAWHPEMTRIVCRVERDEAYIACLEEQLYLFNSYLDGVMKKIDSLKPKEQKNVVPQISF